MNDVVLVGKLREITYVCVEITHHKEVGKVERSSGGLVKEVFKALCNVTVAPFICFRIKIDLDSAQRYITRNIEYLPCTIQPNSLNLLRNVPNSDKVMNAGGLHNRSFPKALCTIRNMLWSMRG